MIDLCCGPGVFGSEREVLRSPCTCRTHCRRGRLLWSPQARPGQTSGSSALCLSATSTQLHSQPVQKPLSRLLLASSPSSTAQDVFWRGLAFVRAPTCYISHRSLHRSPSLNTPSPVSVPAFCLSLVRCPPLPSMCRHSPRRSRSPSALPFGIILGP